MILAGVRLGNVVIVPDLSVFPHVKILKSTGTLNSRVMDDEIPLSLHIAG